MRAVKEWRGRTDDTNIPVKVKLRVFDKYGGKCALTGKKLRAGEFDIDHITPLADWIATPEYPHGNVESNLHPIWRPKHREKTAKENSVRAKVVAKRIKHFEPTKQSKNPIRSAPFQSRLKSPDKSNRIAANHAAHLAKMKQKQEK